MGKNSTNYITFEEAKNKYKDVDTKCKKNSECPDDLYCHDLGQCYYSFICNAKDLTKCIGTENANDYLTKCNANEDCLSGNCVENQCYGSYIEGAVSKDIFQTGYPAGLNCTANDECFSKLCNKGICEDVNLAEAAKALLGLGLATIVGLGALFLICIIGIILCCCCCCKSGKRREIK